MTDPFRSPQGDPGTAFPASYTGPCGTCGDEMGMGETIYAFAGTFICERCWEEASGIDFQ